MNEKIIVGTFNGEQMYGDNMQIYEVPPNYASKSKLVEGDRLKLTIESNGNYIFKQVGPVQRVQVAGVVNEIFQIFADGRNYNVLSASISYFKLQPGDKVSVMLPAEGNPTWAAVDKVIKHSDPDKEIDPRLLARNK